MEKKTDLRIQRTNKLLTDALMELLSEKKFEEIQVAEICERAMVRRATFYKHFGDKYELFTYLINSVQEEFDKNNRIEYDIEHPQAYYIGTISQTFCFLEQNKAMVTSVINSSASHILVDLLSEQIELDMRTKLKADEKRGVAMPAKPEYLAALFAGALVYIARWWVLHDWQPPRDELIDEVANVLKLIK